MPQDPYKKIQSGVNAAAGLAGAGAGFSDPMGGVQNAQAAYHTRQYNKAYNDGMRQAIVNADRASQNRYEMSSAQTQASSGGYGQNGITRENGYVQDADGTIRYVGRQ
ncbi:uncharacterized protein BDV17DRAFT_272423 [Aspergillus undulatus]|uniref:uncharacterized protein n=1 Tax=Aspergillus undulatus TaxID=1810928 RepID=UPI003CCDEB05